MLKNQQYQTIIDNNSRYLAIDYGSKVSGLAMYIKNSDPYPLPFDRIVHRSFAQHLSDILAVIEQEMIEVVIVGVPRLLDNQLTTMSHTIKDFIEKLNSSSSAIVIEWDETLSTYAAEQRMKQSAAYHFKVDLKKIDQVAACIILEDFLGFSSFEI